MGFKLLLVHLLRVFAECYVSFGSKFWWCCICYKDNEIIDVHRWTFLEDLPWLSVGLVHKFVENQPQYKEFAAQMIKQGLTPLFEFCTPHVKSAVTYQEDKLVLISLRNNTSGELIVQDRYLIKRFRTICGLQGDASNGRGIWHRRLVIDVFCE